MIAECWSGVREATTAVSQSERLRGAICTQHQGESCLDRMIFFGEESLRTAIQNIVAHHHSERNHQGMANQLISPEPGHLGNAGEVQRRQRLGGMLNYYYRAAA